MAVTSASGNEAAAADGHAMIVMSDGVRTPSGTWVVGKPVDSIEKLFKVLDYRRLKPAGLPPQVWVTAEAAVVLGWGPDDVDPGAEDDYSAAELAAGKLRTDVLARLDAATRAVVGPFLAGDGEDGWHLFIPGHGVIGHHIHLSRRRGHDTYMVDLILAPWFWTVPSKTDRLGILGADTDGTAIAEDADEYVFARELGRRLAWHVAHIGVLPADTSARTGAVIADRIYRDRTRRGKGVVVKAPGGMPPIELEAEDVEPAVIWARMVTDDDCDRAIGAGQVSAARLVTIDQRASYLASAGMVSLGYGDVRCVAGSDVVAAAHTDVRPFGLWRVVLPAGARVSLPELLPLPHPRMRDDRDVPTWVTTESLRTLTEPVASGGAGLGIDDLGIDEAWLFEHQSLVLKRWKELIAPAYHAAVESGDRVMKKLTGYIYQGYIGRMVNPDYWSATSLRHHHQPVWRAAIMAHARHRARVTATRIADEYGLWPLSGVTDAWTYLVPAGIDIADRSHYLGKYRIEKDSAIDDHSLLALLAAASPAEVRQAITTIHRDHATTDAGQPPDDGMELVDATGEVG